MHLRLPCFVHLGGHTMVKPFASTVIIVAVAIISTMHYSHSRASNASAVAPTGDPTCASSGPCIEYQNTTSGGQGIEGLDNSGIGVFGQTRGASGVKGISTSGNAVYGAAGSGIGVKGISTGGSATSQGVLGIDNGAATVAGPYPAGAEGSSDPSIGVAGYSDLNYGVYGRSRSSSAIVGDTFNPSSLGDSAFGVWGEDAGSGAYNAGVNGTSTNGTGVQGSSRNAYGIAGSTSYPTVGHTSGYAGVTGIDASTDGGVLDDGVYGISNDGIGVFGTSSSFDAVVGESTNDIGVFGSSGASGSTAFGVYGSAVAGIGTTGIGNIGVKGECGDNAPTDEFVGDGGDGTNFTVNCSGSASSVVRSRTGLYAVATLPRATLPVLEDFGEGRLAGGKATVALDPAFAATISDRSPYLVFVTPDGDTKGLYVTGKTMQGFEVREVQGGTSSLTFDYRIVGRPANDDTPRMSLIAHLPRASSRPEAPPPHPERPLVLNRNG